ncbi:MAG: biopolymer transporter ExbD [Planctomycetales bacterium]
MRLPSLHGRREVRADQAMTSMIDVVFLLLIFFVCASIGRIPEKLLPTELAAGAVSAPVEAEPPPEIPRQEYWLRLVRTEAGRTEFEINGSRYGSFVALRPVLAQLGELAGSDPLILDIGPQVPAEDLIRTYDTSLAAGFTAIHFATQAPGKRLKSPE